VIGLTEANAKQALNGLAFVVVVVYELNPAASSTSPTPGITWSISPAVGQTAAGGATVTIKVNPTP